GRVSAAAGAQEAHRGSAAAHCRARGEAGRMSDAAGSTLARTPPRRRRGGRCAAVFVLMLVVAARAAAQQPLLVEPPAGPEFLSRYDFHMTVASLMPPKDTPEALADERFSWDTHFGGSFDLLDLVAGRAG